MYGITDYQGEFSTSIEVLGHGSIKKINSTILSLEKQQEINFNVKGSGFFDQETKSEIHTFTEYSVIDRNTLTYLSREIKGKTEQEKIQDELIIGMPVTDFISTDLSEGQYVEYYSIDGLINCKVSHGETDDNGKKLHTIILSYSGPTAQDPWLETNGTATHKFIFEKNTGLLISSSSTTETVGDKGRRITKFEYELDSTTFWTFNELQESSTTSITSLVETSTDKTSNEIEEDFNGQTDYFIPILIVIIISIIVIALIELRRHNLLNKMQKNQDDKS